MFFGSSHGVSRTFVAAERSRNVYNKVDCVPFRTMQQSNVYGVKTPSCGKVSAFRQIKCEQGKKQRKRGEDLCSAESVWMANIYCSQCSNSWKKNRALRKIVLCYRNESNIHAKCLRSSPQFMISKFSWKECEANGPPSHEMHYILTAHTTPENTKLNVLFSALCYIYPKCTH